MVNINSYSPEKLKNIPIIHPYKFTFSFYHLKDSKQKEAIFFSILGILPIFGALASIAGARSRGFLELVHNNNPHHIKQKFICLVLGTLRTLLSFFGLGILFFLLDIICTLSAYIEEKINKSSSTFSSKISQNL